jgi:hypothetical protein
MCIRCKRYIRVKKFLLHNPRDVYSVNVRIMIDSDDHLNYLNYLNFLNHPNHFYAGYLTLFFRCVLSLWMYVDCFAE